MKVLIVGPWVSPIIKRLARAMAGSGCSVVVASHNLSLSDIDSKDNIYFENLGVLNNFLGYFKFWNINQLVRKHEPDLVHAHILNHYGLMALMVKAPLIVALWGSDVLVAPKKGSLIKRTFYKFINILVLKRANYVHTSGSHVMAEAVRLCPAVHVKSSIFYWGFPVEKGSEQLQELIGRRLRKEFFIEGKGFYIFNRGLNPIYNPNLTTKIIKQLSILGLSRKIIVLKAFTSKANEESFLASMKGVEFIYVNRLLQDEELYWLYTHSRYHFSLCLSDSLGGGVVEPAQLGSIPVLSNIAPYREYIVDSNGILIENEETVYIDDILESVTSLSQNHEGNMKISYASVVAQFQALYNTVGGNS